MKNSTLKTITDHVPALCIAVTLLLSITTIASAGSPVITGMFVEGHASPLALKNTTPRFSWIIKDPERWDQTKSFRGEEKYREVQNAYRILVASSRALIDEDKGDLWDSGKVMSSNSTWIPYEGIPLEGKARCWWKVRTWDRADEPGPFSEVDFFETGLQEDDWKAHFIWDGTDNTNNFCYLRKQFEIPGDVAHARIYLFAHDDYKLFINGRFTGRGPAPSDPYHAALYNTYDITSLLSPGPNVIAVIAHYHGEGTGCGIKGTPAFICQAEIEYHDGETAKVISDSSWRCRAETPWDESSPCRGPHYARATSVESIDARKRVDGWMTPGFNDSSWSCAEKAEPGYRLEAQLIPGTEIREERPPIRIEYREPNIHFLDFGCNCTGWPELKIDNAEPGRKIRIWYAEEADDHKIVRNGNTIDHYFDEYICSGGSEIFEPDTKYNGFRYVEIEGYPGKLTHDDIRLKYAHTRLKKEGAFQCSSPLLNDIYEISVRTQVNACQGLLTDCPQREQAQYIADAVIQGLNLFYNFGYSGLHRKFLYDISHSFKKPGFISAQHPSETLTLIPEWILHWPIGIWNHYLYTGDRKVVDDLYPLARKTLAIFARFEDSKTHLLKNVPGDSLSDHPLSTMDNIVEALTPLNCLYYQALTVTAKMAGTLSLKDEEKTLTQASARIKQAINTHLFDGKSRYMDCLGSEKSHALASAFPLCFGIVPEENIPEVLDHIVSRGFEPSVYGGFYLCEALYKYDRADHLHALIRNEDALWGKMLAEGSTTTWEAWMKGGSLSHAWSAYPMKFLLSGLVGIEPLSPGFSTFRIKPHVVDGIKFAEGTVPTPRGLIRAEWKRTGNGLSLRVEIPVNTKAEIQLPTLGLEEFAVFESGFPVAKGHWARNKPPGFLPMDLSDHDGPGRVNFCVGSGIYSFLIREWEVD